MSDRNQHAGQTRIPWLALTATALGISAAAWVISSKLRAPARRAESILDICERAASELDQRITETALRYA